MLLHAQFWDYSLPTKKHVLLWFKTDFYLTNKEETTSQQNRFPKFYLEISEYVF